MAIDPKNPKQPKKVLPVPKTTRPIKAALDYGDLVRMREFLLEELIEDMGGQVTVTPELLVIVERRLANVILAGMEKADLSNFLEE